MQQAKSGTLPAMWRSMPGMLSDLRKIFTERNRH
jgi:hypothetical protein